MRLHAAFIALFLFLFSISTASALDNDVSRASLKGLDGVAVFVEEEVTPEVRAALADLRTDVELKLRLAGIPVLNPIATPGQPTLYIYLNVASSTTFDLWPYAMDIQLRQNAILARSPQIRVLQADTWSAGYGATTGSVTKYNVARLREDLKDLVDKFIKAYLSVNPKK